MRKVVSISLPEETVSFIDAQIKKRNFTTKSEYFKYLVSLDQNVITEDELVEIRDQAIAEYRAGESIEAESMADLL